MTGGAANDLVDSENSLGFEQAQVISKNGMSSIPMNFLLAVSIAIILRSEIGVKPLALWLGVVFVVNTLRFYKSFINLSKQLDEDAVRSALKFQSFVMFVTGIVWAVVPGYLLDLNSPHASHIFFILAGITAGATLQSGAYSYGGTAFALPIFVTLIGRLIVCGQDAYLLAFDAILFLLLLIRTARLNEESFAKAVGLKTRATSLAISLDREHTASKAAAARFFELANHDPLTGLPNRAAFATSLSGLLARVRAKDGGFYLFLLDLDHFKSINDTLGHSAGDEVLQETAKRLGATVAGEQIVARLGGDEFAVLLPHPAGQVSVDDTAETIATRLLNEVGGSFVIGEQSVTIGVSIGVAKFPEDGVTAENLLAHADLALYAAKDGGRHRWRRFDARLLADATMTRDIEHDLPAALAEGALQIVYQPQVALGDHRLVGLEALLRWNHPVHGWISPPLVVAAAHRIRKSELLTGFVLDQACRQIRRLDDEGMPDVSVAVNVSPSELGRYALPDLVRHLAATHGVACPRLEIEITEEAFAASEEALATLSELSATGVRLAIDDFGTGYSSIAYLGRMHVDRIKIDRGFVTGFAQRPGDRILVQAILGIGRSLGIEVLAEGVETAADVVVLEALGCGVVQGYHFGRPMEPAALDRWIIARADATSPPRDAATLRNDGHVFAFPHEKVA